MTSLAQSTVNLGFQPLLPSGLIPSDMQSAMERLDVFLQELDLFSGGFVRVIDRDLTAPPAEYPEHGDVYLVAASATGEWAGHDGELAYWIAAVDAWRFRPLWEGLCLRIVDEGLNVQQGASSLAAIERVALLIAVGDETTNLSTGAAKKTFRMPFAMTLTAVRASVNTAPATTSIIVDINEDGTSVISTKLSIDAAAKTSVGSVAPYVISDAALANDAEITIDLDQVGTGTTGKGLNVWLIGTRA